MRRPLCLAALAWLGILAWGLFLGKYSPMEGYGEVRTLLDGQVVTVTGRVAGITGTGDDRCLYLDRASLVCTGKFKQDMEISSAAHAGEIFFAGQAVGQIPAGVRIAVRPEEGAGEAACDDMIRVRGKAAFPGRPSNPGQFDDELYCLNRDILFRIYDARVLNVRQGFGVRRLLQRLRDLVAGSYRSCLGGEEAALLTGITLGDSTEVSADTKSLFREGGIAHILAISGLHVNLVAMGAYGLLRRRRLPIPVCVLCSLLLFAFYMIMTGMSLSCLRAFILFALWCLARVTGRKTDTATSLALAAAVLATARPGLLMDSGFWLSFGCVCSLFLLEGPVRSLLFPSRARRRKGKRDGARRRGPGDGGEPEPEQESRARVPAWGRAFAASLAVSLGTFPVCAFFFYRVTPWSLAVNLLILPCMGVLFAFACLGGGLGLVFAPAGSFVLSVCHYLLRLFVLVCRAERRLPFAVLITGRPAVWQLVLYYPVLALILFPALRKSVFTLLCRRGRLPGPDGTSFPALSGRIRRFPAGRRAGKAGGKKGRAFRKKGGRARQASRALIRGLLLTAVCICILKLRIWPSLRVTVLDVGQGDSILIQVGSHSFLSDCGSSSVDRVWSRRVSPALQYYGICALDGVFVSHGDSDHINGLREWLEGYERNLTGSHCADVSAGAVFLGKGAAADEAAAGIGRLAREKGLPVFVLAPGDRVSCGGASLTCLYPSDAAVEALGGDGNMTSMVLELCRGPIRLLLTGDLEKEGEELFVRLLRDAAGREEDPAGGERRQVVLKAGHHGSRYATSDALLALLRPDITLISCGRGNSYGHPAQEVLRRLLDAGSLVYRTDEEGCIILEEKKNALLKNRRIHWIM